MKNFLLGIVATLVALGLGTFVYLRLGFAEVRADLPPAAWEMQLFPTFVRASVQRRAPRIPNPYPTTDALLIEGGKVYLEGCAGCHGGLDKPDENSGALFPPAPDFPRAGTAYTETQIFWIAKHGLRRTGMFAAGMFNSDEKLWKAAAFIYHIKSLPPNVKAALEEKKAAP